MKTAAAVLAAAALLSGCEIVQKVEPYYRKVVGDYVTERTLPSKAADVAACIERNARNLRNVQFIEPPKADGDRHALNLRVQHATSAALRIDVTPAAQGSNIRMEFTPLEYAARRELIELLLKGC